MRTVDLRTRFLGDAVTVDPATFLADVVPTIPGERRVEAGRAAVALGLPPLTLDVAGERVTLSPSEEGLGIGAADGHALRAALDLEAFSDLVQDVASTFGLHLSARAEVAEGSVDNYLRWEPVLRCLLDGRPVYRPGLVTFCDRDGGPLDLTRSFRIDDDPDEIGDFLVEAGYLHLEGVFTEDEMAAVSADLDVAIARASQDDGASWWARTEDEWYPSRILGFNHQSPALRELLRSERFRTISTFTDDDYVQRDPDTADAAEGLLKKVGVVEGISDVSWHKDCALGGHSRGCCGLTVGISVTGAGRENGELGAIAGSHRANTALLGGSDLDLPHVPLPTRTGDLTVHCSCTFHMSRPPTSAERRVVYTGFGLAPRPGDVSAIPDPEQIRRDRAAQNDHVRRSQQSGLPAEQMSKFDL